MTALYDASHRHDTAEETGQAHARARRAHLASADHHVAAAETHDRAAQTHRRAAEAGIGDVKTHWEAVVVHEAARDDDYHAAEAARRLARSE
ncbi:hypothetical protein MycrhN_5335 [Mycolicibacterium rhodesiae NBB3]|jgi:hypothetical protein|uniref:Uncharacterized protein n=1 Tax=Mycolicibacterium rhodesiae (strain NBB3) TaxID=710685 RepID=G8RHE0_MYCRN|nr:hypothetical protein [Mycolicibacterium rhodesiae]AEV75810.1 hypothetical protein MycrhN_5335 [Mycolicibacterium rhodesiae NBB3]